MEFLTSRFSVVTPPASNVLHSAAFFELTGGDKQEKLAKTHTIIVVRVLKRPVLFSRDDYSVCRRRRRRHSSIYLRHVVSSSRYDVELNEHLLHDKQGREAGTKAKQQEPWAIGGGEGSPGRWRGVGFGDNGLRERC
jgi:hypothetical protein